jgi:hypothetical protein
MSYMHLNSYIPYVHYITTEDTSERSMAAMVPNDLFPDTSSFTVKFDTAKVQSSSS